MLINPPWHCPPAHEGTTTLEGLWPVFSASAAFTPALLLPVQRSDLNPKRDLSLCEEGWEVCFLSAFRTKKQRFDPNSYPVLLQRAWCCCHHLDGQSDSRSGLKVPSYECCSSLPLLLLQIQPLLEKKKKKICYHWAYATAKHPIQYNFSLFWELHFTVSLYSVCLSDIAH